MNEIWKDIKGYEGQYQVSNLGNVRSFKRGAARVMTKYCVTRHGHTYQFVCLNTNRKNKSMYVHRLVAEAFIPNPHNRPFVDHISRETTDNNVKNLRWATNRENLNNPNTVKARHGNVTKRCRPVIEFRGGVRVAEYPSARAAARATGINQHTISYCCTKSKKKMVKSKIHFEYC